MKRRQRAEKRANMKIRRCSWDEWSGLWVEGLLGATAHSSFPIIECPFAFWIMEVKGVRGAMCSEHVPNCAAGDFLPEEYQPDWILLALADQNEASTAAQTCLQRWGKLLMFHLSAHRLRSISGKKVVVHLVWLKESKGWDQSMMTLSDAHMAMAQQVFFPDGASPLLVGGLEHFFYFPIYWE